MFFGGFGGMPGGGGGHGDGGEREVNNTRFYEVLSVSQTASVDEIKKAYRKAALTHHPDRGGDPEKFKEISRAHEILSDPQKRALYDEGGEEALEAGGGGGGGAGPMDIFDLFGGGMFGGRDSTRKKRGEDVTFPLRVTLDEVYMGTSKKLRLTKNVLCAGCKGAGGKGGKDATCQGCKGQGIRMIMRQIGPGMIQQMQAKCSVCSGTGSCLSDKDKCTACHGARTVKEKKALEVFITKGMKHGERIVYRGEADEAPNTVTGDVVVVVQVADHAFFRRDGNHLFVKRKITLIEALTGFSFLITHLDGRVLRVASEDGMCVKPGDVKMIEGEGMPLPRTPHIRGNLYVEMDVEFPTPAQLDEKTVRALSAVLPRPAKAAGAEMRKSVPPPHADGSGRQPASDHPDLQDFYEVHLSGVDMAQERRRWAEQERHAREDMEEDEDDEGHAHGRPAPGCQQQ